MEQFALSPGPQVGRLLEAVREAQAAGQVSSLNEAMKLVESPWRGVSRRLVFSSRVNFAEHRLVETPAAQCMRAAHDRQRGNPVFFIGPFGFSASRATLLRHYQAYIQHAGIFHQSLERYGGVGKFRQSAWQLTQTDAASGDCALHLEQVCTHGLPTYFRLL